MGEMKLLEAQIRQDAVVASASAPPARDEQEKYRLQRVRTPCTGDTKLG